ncbi:outer membrane protein [Ancylobacter lacus]|uniref:outer membrane protein n=1 Tax=Ancylobacter lacus TaxID=2579970 RepID=UPI001BCF43EE|nr:outer membrane beta-barrel protein [Ancylobacter lacus]MBS7539202.1 porin family protein [Ancylobacter lacus]
MKYVTTAMVLLATAVPAFAADMATKAPAAVATPAAPVISWQGFYVGGTAGVAIDNSSVSTEAGGWFSNSSVAGNYTEDFGGSSTGLTVGGTVGYNWQWDNVVAGVEADLSYADRSESGNSSIASTTQSGTSIDKHYALDGNWYGTLRARLGVTVGPSLIYATGGAAFGQADASVSVQGGPYYSWNASESDTRWGWTVGGGVETQFDPHWSFKIEYLYVDLGSSNFDLTNGAGNPIPDYTLSAHADYAFSVVRAGINYRF